MNSFSNDVDDEQGRLKKRYNIYRSIKTSPKKGSGDVRVTLICAMTFCQMQGRSEGLKDVLGVKCIPMGT